MSDCVLVTGAAGFLGRYVGRALGGSDRLVIGVARSKCEPAQYAAWGFGEWSARGVSAEGLRPYEGRVAAIYHCAGSGSVSKSLAEPREDFESNVVTTLEVLEFARRQPGVKVIVPSSASVYGALVEQPIRADAPHNPISPYGINKGICETLCQQYTKFFGVDVALIRFFSIYGPGLRKQLLWDACNKLMRGERKFFGTGKETRHWIHASDAALLMIHAAGVPGPSVMNGAAGRPFEVREVLELLAHLLDVRAPIQFNGEIRSGDPVHYNADLTEAFATGWRPKIEFESGLVEYARWFSTWRAQT